MLQQRLRGLRKNNKKGFTLVELLVVIVILCILAAILIPTFSKYVKKAENATVVAEARAAHVAASVLCQEANIKARTAAGYVEGAAVNYSAVTNTEIKDLASVDGTMEKIWVDSTGTVVGFYYKSKNGHLVAWGKESGMYDTEFNGTGTPSGVPTTGATDFQPGT